MTKELNPNDPLGENFDSRAGVHDEKYKRMEETISLAKGKVSFIVLVGSSGVGKSYIEKIAKKTHSEEVNLSISATSRPPREKNGEPVEFDGKDYYFLEGIDEFKNTPMLESEILKTKNGSLTGYGTPLKGVMDSFSEGKHILLSLDPQGAKTIKENFPNTVLCLLNPSKEKVLDMAKKTMKGASQEDFDAHMKRIDRFDIVGKAQKLNLFDNAEHWYSNSDSLKKEDAKTFLVDTYLRENEIQIFLSTVLKEADRVGVPPKEGVTALQEFYKKTKKPIPKIRKKPPKRIKP